MPVSMQLELAQMITAVLKQNVDTSNRLMHILDHLRRMHPELNKEEK